MELNITISEEEWNHICMQLLPTSTNSHKLWEFIWKNLVFFITHKNKKQTMCKAYVDKQMQIIYLSSKTAKS